jgi:hypothetical protein
MVALPAAFADLEPLAQRFALPTERARHTARLTADFADLQRFYDTVLPRMPDIHAHLSAQPWPDQPEPAQRLMNLALFLMEIALAIESHSQSTVPYGFDWQRFEVAF